MAKEASKPNNDKRSEASPPAQQGQSQQAQPTSKTSAPRYDDRPDEASSSGKGQQGREPRTNPDLPRYDDRPGDATKSAAPRSPNYGDDEPDDPRKLETEARNNPRSARSIEARDQGQAPQ